MLDSITKRRIDACRDILVGKVPDPKSQVEQITIALIYKFMDDMDAEAEELGGQRSFFAGEYARFGWAKLMAPSMGGFEVLALYAEAIGKMNENPGIPALFRDIFKNAYLPYRDPETLRAFLKEIDGFTYDHSERLGDAFEYLLSVLGSQGDAGQFRTPRHIIDFMVDVINPQKNESVLDPACGTAGFLISAWKHILKQNTKDRAGDLLTPTERANLVANIHGYDISPDMVRLSLVNLYLHGFTDPHIVEYDTLTSEERWNETADVILANPPFMSPKGGIKPHKRFSVQATRSEVLFVDYMAEHLSPQGRAAIVVPEGIIFQSGTAYKKLREMLVKTSLVAVVSLPAGVFNPYSGVKTSILILDKRLAKTCDSVLFVKVENDGFGLGAQRRAVTGDDLPEAKRCLLSFVSNAEAFENCAMAHKVPREKIGGNGEWNLSGERYVESAPLRRHAFSLSTVGEIVERVSESVDPTVAAGKVAYVGLENIESQTGRLLGVIQSDFSEIKSLKSKFAVGDILYGKLRPNLNKVHLASISGICSTDIFVLRAKDGIEPRFVGEVMRSPQFNDEVLKGLGGAQLPRVGYEYLKELTVPVPPLVIQQEIVAEIEGYQKIIDGARQVVENYRPRTDVQPDWPLLPLSEVLRLSSGEFLSAAMMKDGPYPVYGGNGVNGTHDQFTFETPTVVIGRVGAYCGAVHLTQPKAWVTDNGLYVKELLKPVDLRFLELALRNLNLNQYAKVGGQPSISQSTVLEREIALPNLETQRAIVAEIEAEQELVNANKQLIARFEAKIKATIDRVWGSSE